jgi:hypothetical protein
MAQVVRHIAVTAEARVRAQVSPCEISDGQSGTGTGFSSSYLVSSVNNTLSSGPQFRDIVSPHRHEQQHTFMGRYEH